MALTKPQKTDEMESRRGEDVSMPYRVFHEHPLRRPRKKPSPHRTISG